MDYTGIQSPQILPFPLSKNIKCLIQETDIHVHNRENVGKGVGKNQFLHLKCMHEYTW